MIEFCCEMIGSLINKLLWQIILHLQQGSLLARQCLLALAYISDTISVLALHPTHDTTLLLHLFSSLFAKTTQESCHQQGKQLCILMKQLMMG